MKVAKTILITIVLLEGVAHLSASGPLGIFGIVEKVVLEPSEQSPERIQVWGVFAYVDAGSEGVQAVSVAKRGYLYFKLPALTQGVTNQSQIETVKKEWADLKVVAGTGQAIGFGLWDYIGSFGRLQPDTRNSMPPYILERVPRGGAQTDLRVRPASEAPTLPATYQTNAGVVKLTDSGSHAAIVKQLKESIKR